MWNEGLGLWCLMPLFTIFQLYRGGQFLLVEETGENHRPVTDKLCHIMLYWVDLAMNHEISQHLIKYKGIMIYFFVGNITVVKEVIIMYR